MNDVVTIEPRAKPQIIAGSRPKAIVPTDMDSAYRLANAVCEAGMAPAGIDTPAKAMVAIMHGLEIGLPPMAALQRIAVVNGRPTIWGDAAIGLVRASHLCEWIKERIEGDGDSRVAVCEAKRRGDNEPCISRFSVVDAKRAGLWSPDARVTRFKKDGGTYQKDNDSPWHRYPERMLQMRARGFCLRDLFADVLGGLYLREEIEDEIIAARPTPPTPPVPPKPPALQQIEEKAPEAPKPTPPTPPRPPSASAHPVPPKPAPALSPLDAYKEAVAKAETVDDVELAWMDHVEAHMRANAIDRETYETIKAIENEAMQRFEP